MAVMALFTKKSDADCYGEPDGVIPLLTVFIQPNNPQKKCIR